MSFRVGEKYLSRVLNFCGNMINMETLPIHLLIGPFFSKEDSKLAGGWFAEAILSGTSLPEKRVIHFGLNPNKNNFEILYLNQRETERERDCVRRG